MREPGVLSATVNLATKMGTVKVAPDGPTAQVPLPTMHTGWGLWSHCSNANKANRHT